MSQADYSAFVKVLNEDIYVDTKTGQGFDLVLKKMDPVLNKLSHKIYIPGFFFEDVKQELSILTLEGIRNYNPSKKIKLSSFLQVHLKNKIISKLLTTNKGQRNALDFGKESEQKIHENDFKENKTKYKKIREEIIVSQIKMYDDESSGSSQDFMSQVDSGFMCSKFTKAKEVDFNYSLANALKVADPDVRKIVELVLYNDYTIEEAAKEIGITTWAACIRLKKLSRIGKIRELFGRRE